MPDITVGCAEVNVVRVAIPRFRVVPPTSTVQVRNPDTSLIVKNPSLKVTVREPDNQTHIILPVPGPSGPQGQPGPPGDGSAVQEIYVQAAQPTEGSFPWYWFETDGAGSLTGNEFVYDPDGL